MRSYCPGDKIDLAVWGCKGEPFKEVTLSRIRPCGDRVLTKLAVTEDTYEATLPDAVCEGVWRLTVQTACGCHSTLVHIACDRLMFEHKREVSNHRPIARVCCDKDNVSPAPNQPNPPATPPAASPDAQPTPPAASPDAQPTPPAASPDAQPTPPAASPDAQPGVQP